MTEGTGMGTGYRVICADDDPITCAIYDHVFTRRGFEMVIVDNGEAAMACFIESPADVVILDVQMQGMGGMEVCRALRSLNIGKHVPIIIMSAHSADELVVRAEEAGADAVMQKPLQTGPLIEKCLFLIRRHELLKRYLEEGVEPEAALKLLCPDRDVHASDSTLSSQLQ